MLNFGTSFFFGIRVKSGFNSLTRNIPKRSQTFLEFRSICLKCKFCIYLFIFSIYLGIFYIGKIFTEN